MFCPKCGSLIKESTRFCPYCGSAIESTTPSRDADQSVLSPTQEKATGSEGNTSPFPIIRESPSQQPFVNERPVREKSGGVPALITIACIALGLSALTLGITLGRSLSSEEQRDVVATSSQAYAESTADVNETEEAAESASTSDGAETTSESPDLSVDNSSAYEPTLAHIDRAYKEEMSAMHSRPLGYVLSGSDHHVYERSVVEQLSNDELWYARNELYARYGKGFRTPELKEHFESTPWYYEVYSADDFDKLPDMLNSAERSNLETISSVERERNSPHAK